VISRELVHTTLTASHRLPSASYACGNNSISNGIYQTTNNNNKVASDSFHKQAMHIKLLKYSGIECKHISKIKHKSHLSV